MNKCITIEEGEYYTLYNIVHQVEDIYKILKINSIEGTFSIPNARHSYDFKQVEGANVGYRSTFIEYSAFHRELKKYPKLKRILLVDDKEDGEK